MPTSSQLRGAICALSSLEGERTRAPSRPTTNTTSSAGENVVDRATLEQERMDRTNDVRERIGPLIGRLKDSATKIRALQNSMQVSADGDDRDGRDDRDMDEKDGTAGLLSASSPEKLQKQMNESMEMVKKKMFRLKTMEEELATLEDRRVNLHHYFHQQVAQNAMPKGNSEDQNRAMKKEEEGRLLHEKSLLVHDLIAQNVRLLEKTKDVHQLERELKAERSLREKLESNLQEHQHKIDQQAIKYDSLNSKFQDSMVTIANLRKLLEAQDTMERMALQSPPQTIEQPGTNESVALTEPMSLSWTESSISNASTVENDDSNAGEESPVAREDTNTTSRSTVQILREKVEALNRENARLRANKNHTVNKYKSLHEEMKRQSSIIEDLRQKVHRRVLEGGEQC